MFMGGKSFFKMSDECMKVEDFFINGDTFDAIYNNGINIERISLLLHYIIENSPFAFKEQPLLYETHLGSGSTCTQCNMGSLGGFHHG